DAVPLLLPPAAGREVGHASLDLAGERERGPAHLHETPAALDAAEDVHATRTRGLREAGDAVVGQYVAAGERDPPHVIPRHTRDRIEINPQLVRMLEVVRAYRMRVHIHAAEVHDPSELRSVAQHDLVRGAAARIAQFDRFDPVWAILRRPLLVERLPL